MACQKEGETDVSTTVSSSTPLLVTNVTHEQHVEDCDVQTPSMCDKDKRRLERNKYQHEYRTMKKMEKFDLNKGSATPDTLELGSCSTMDQFTQCRTRYSIVDQLPIVITNDIETLDNFEPSSSCDVDK